MNAPQLDVSPSYITIFNGRSRSPSGGKRDIYATVSVDLRCKVSQFKMGNSLNPFAVFTVIALHADENGWVSTCDTPTLMKETGLESEGAITNSIKHLRNLKLDNKFPVLHHYREKRANGQWGKSYYHIFPCAGGVDNPPVDNATLIPWNPESKDNPPPVLPGVVVPCVVLGGDSLVDLNALEEYVPHEGVRWIAPEPPPTIQGAISVRWQDDKQLSGKFTNHAFEVCDLYGLDRFQVPDLIALALGMDVQNYRGVYDEAITALDNAGSKAAKENLLTITVNVRYEIEGSQTLIHKVDSKEPNRCVCQRRITKRHMTTVVVPGAVECSTCFPKPIPNYKPIFASFAKNVWNIQPGTRIPKLTAFKIDETCKAQLGDYPDTQDWEITEFCKEWRGSKPNADFPMGNNFPMHFGLLRSRLKKPTNGTTLPVTPKHDLACKLCGGSGMILTTDTRGNTFGEPCKGEQ